MSKNEELWALLQRLPEGDPVRESGERAITVPYDYDPQTAFLHIGLRPDHGTGRVLRPQPGVMACPDAFHDKPWPHDGSRCTMCGGGRAVRETVPDPSGVVARLEACGRLMPVHVALHEAGQQGTGLLGKLIVSDYDGAMPLILEAVRALAAQEVA